MNMKELVSSVVNAIATQVSAAAAEVAEKEITRLLEGTSTVAEATVVVHEYVKSTFGNIITLPQFDTDDAPNVDLDEDEVRDALDLDYVPDAPQFFFVNVYRVRVANKGDRLGTNGYVLGKKLFSSEAEAYKRRRGRLSKDGGYEGVIAITPRQAKAKGYSVL